MQSHRIVMISLLATFAFGLRSQPVKIDTLPSYPISIGLSQTTNIIFPSPIISVDRGSAEVLAQQAIGVKNVLQVKAANPTLSPSSLSVITSDGSIYSFRVLYSKEPGAIAIKMSRDLNISRDVQMSSGLFSDELQHFSDSIKVLPRGTHGSASDGWVRVTLKNIIADSGKVWLSMEIHNYSDIPVVLESLRVQVVSRQKLKRTASQERTITPLYTDTLGIITNQHPVLFCLCLPAQSISFSKTDHLAMQLSSLSGQHTITLSISRQKLLRAKKL